MLVIIRFRRRELNNKIFFGILSCMVAFVSPCSAEENGGSLNGSDLQAICSDSSADSKAACRFYILGITQGIELGMGIADGETQGGRPCIPDNIPSSTLELLVKMKLGQDLMVYPGDKKLSASGIISAILISAYRCDKTRSEQQQQIKPIRKKIKDIPVNVQAQCSEMARKFLSSRGLGIGNEDDFKNHYNSKLKKCFILVLNSSTKDDFLSLDLYDAIEGNRYATYIGHVTCNDVVTYDAQKCALDAGSIWYDGNDNKKPNFTVSNKEGSYGVGLDGLNIYKEFLDRIQPFMSE